jgi:hypothetical protein
MASIGNVGKDLLVLDPTLLSESDNVGAYLRSSDGTLLTHSTVNAKESLDVNLSQLDADATAEVFGLYNEDEAHDSGDRGQFVMAVQQATKASFGDEGDYVPFQMNDSGELYVIDEDAHTKLDSVISELQDIETDVESVNTNLTTVISELQDIETDVESAVSQLQDINTELDNIYVEAQKIDDVQYAEDSGHISGDSGNFVLAVANHTEGPLHDTDGDYAPFQVDNQGRLRVIADLDASEMAGDVADDDIDSGNPVKIGFKAYSGPLGALSASGDRADGISDLYRRQYVTTSSNIGIAAGTVSVSDSETQLFAGVANLAGRRSIMIQNLGTRAIYIGPTGVTTANGIRIARGANMPVEIGEDLDIYAIAAAGAQDVRVMEIG